MPKLTVDGANGIGALKMAQFKDHLESVLDVRVVNDGSSGKLNHMVS